MDEELGLEEARDGPAGGDRGRPRLRRGSGSTSSARTFKRLGVFGRWDEPYATMDRRYEADTVRALARVAEKGFLSRGKKPVYWCTTDRTALAEAEVEYEDHTSPSIHVAFDVVGDLPAPALAGRAAQPGHLDHHPLDAAGQPGGGRPPRLRLRRLRPRAARWWWWRRTCSAAFLAAVAPDELVDGAAPALAAAHEAATGGAGVRARTGPVRILATWRARSSRGSGTATRSWGASRRSSSASTSRSRPAPASSTPRPGHGQEDYEVGHEVRARGPEPGRRRRRLHRGGRQVRRQEDLRGQRRDRGRPARLRPPALRPQGLAHATATRTAGAATSRWSSAPPTSGSSRSSTTGCASRTLDEIDRVHWIPRWGRDRIYNMIEHRPDWCLSRQRTWGVPIPVFYCEGCDEPLVSPALMRRVADEFEKEGIEAWYRHEPGPLHRRVRRAATCGGADFRREQDILDVWWDSGVSWAAVAERGREQRASRSTSTWRAPTSTAAGSTRRCSPAMAIRGSAPYKAVLTHGFVLDGQGKAMSKSVGNVVAPEEIIKKYGADVLRLWVAASDYRDDVRVSGADPRRPRRGLPQDPQHRALGAREPGRLRPGAATRCRWPSWSPSTAGPSPGWSSGRTRCAKAYDDYEFHVAYHATMQLCAVTSPSVYFDVVKDRLYTARSRTARPRRSAQTVLHTVAQDLLRLLAPVLSFTASEAWSYLPGRPAGSVFLAGLPARAAAGRRRGARRRATRKLLRGAREAVQRRWRWPAGTSSSARASRRR